MNHGSESRHDVMGPPLLARHRIEGSLAAFLAIGVSALLTYGGHLHNPLFFDSVSWFSEEHLRALRDLHTSDRYVSKKITYWLYVILGGRVELLNGANLLCHAMTASVTFLLFRRLISLAIADPQSPLQRSAAGAALAVAVLFTVHPVQVYAVGYLGQMELVLATLFSLLMLLMYLEGLIRSSRRLLVLSVLFYLLAVLSKENAITVPVVALALTLLVRRPSWPLVREVAPYYGLIGVIAVWIFLREVGAPHHISDVETLRASGGATLHGLFGPASLHLRSLITESCLFFRYVLLWLIPYVGWMSIDLQYPLAQGVGWREGAGLAGFCLYPVAAAWLLLRRGATGMVGFGLLWPWLLFLPELAATRVTENFVLYRSYLWIAGLLAAVVVALVGTLGRRAVPLICVLCVGLGVLAHERLWTFRSSYALWDDAVRKNRPYEETAPGAYRAYLNRGRALLDLHRTEAALDDFATTLVLRPGLPYAYFNRGLAYVQLRRYPDALVAFDEGMAASAQIPEGARAAAFSNRAGVHLLLGQPAAAADDLARAVALDPERAEYRFNLERLRQELRSPAASTR